MIDPEKPIVEYPSERYHSVVDAIADALRRAASPELADRSVVFCAQGQEGEGETYRFTEFSYRNGVMSFGRPVLGLEGMAESAGLEPCGSSVRDGSTAIDVTGLDPDRVARLLDQIYGQSFGIKPFGSEADYAFGAELE